jgi:hypothetical protein
MKKTISMRYTGTLWCGLVCGAILAFSPNLHAQTDALQGFSGGSTPAWGASTGYTFGWQFQANQDISVTTLGVYDLGGWFNPEWTTGHEVSLWNDSNQQLLANVTVTASDPESQDANGNNIRWVTLSTPVQLSANVTYDIAAYYPHAGFAMDYFQYQCSSVTTDSQITYLQSVRTDVDGPFTFPDMFADHDDAFFGPNFQIESVPEPSALALLGIGFIILVGWQRQRVQPKA